MKRIASFATNALLLTVILGALGFFIAPRFGLIDPIEIKIVRSGSMAPAIPTGSVVAIQKAASYAVGDVITFGVDNQTHIPTTHRITALETNGTITSYATKGDANEDADPAFVSENRVIGKVVFSLPVAGYILAFAKEPLGFALLIVIPAALLIAYELINVWNEFKTLARRKRAEKTLSKIARSALDEVLPPKPPRQAPRRRIASIALVGRHFDIEAPFRQNHV